MHLHPPVQNTTGCRIPQKWYVRGGISLTNRHMLSIVSCKSLGMPASGYLNTWKVGTLWTRSIEVAQLPKICSGNNSHTRSLIPVAFSLKSTVFLKTGRRLQPVTWSLILLVRSAQFWKGQGESGPRLFLLRRWTSWDGTGPLALGPCHALRLHLPNDERGYSYRGSSVPPACPIGALRHNALL